MSYHPIDPSQYSALFAAKCHSYQQIFRPFDCPDFELFPSQPIHYRLRAEFRVWHQNNDLYHIMFNAADKSKIRINNWLPAAKPIYDLMPLLIEQLKQQPILRDKLFQIDYLTSLSKQVVISLLYHRPLCDQWRQAAIALKQQFSSSDHYGSKIDIIGRSRKQKVVIDRDFVDETLLINGKQLHYRQIENSFTQPNGLINQCMIEWAIDVSKNQVGDLLELYCGNGNFSIALAEHFDKVLATEIAKSAVDAAHINLTRNHVDNVTVLRMSAEDLSTALAGEKQFRRLKNIKLNDYQCNTVLVDPPRSGLDKITETLVSHYDNIIYISCNPHSLVENLSTLCKSHRISRFAMFDQFPYTEHLECGVFLQRKSS